MESAAEEVRADECDARADEEGQGGFQAWQDQYLPQERRSPPWQTQVQGYFMTVNVDCKLLSVSYRYLKDFFTSMIELSWSWTLFSFAASFFISWLGFAVAWWTFFFFEPLFFVYPVFNIGTLWCWHMETSERTLQMTMWCVSEEIYLLEKKKEKISSGLRWQYKTRWCLHVLLPVQSWDPAHDRVNCSLNFFLTFLPF